MTETKFYPFRVFLSYAHQDEALVQAIADVLESLGLEPLWDKRISPGTPFTDSIREFIERCHLFVPVLTANSYARPWVHQETGYAIALKIPVLPLAIGKLPDEMIAFLHAISIPENLEGLADRIRAINLENIIIAKPTKPPGTFHRAQWPEERTNLIIRYATWVLELGKYGHIYHRGLMSSFAVPDCDLNHPIWQERDGDTMRSEYYHHLQREERRLLELHAQHAGCSLLLDPAATSHNVRGKRVHATRLKILSDFLGNAPPNTEIVFSDAARAGNLILVGDYFFAEGLVPRIGGYFETIFNSHPPSVLERLRKFQDDFERMKRLHEVMTPEQAKARVDELHDSLPPDEQCVAPPLR